jgi:hypothetical protein
MWGTFFDSKGLYRMCAYLYVCSSDDRISPATLQADLRIIKFRLDQRVYILSFQDEPVGVVATRCMLAQLYSCLCANSTPLYIFYMRALACMQMIIAHLCPWQLAYDNTCVIVYHFLICNIICEIITAESKLPKI